MSLDVSAIMRALQVFLVVVGGVTIVWGIYDLFGDGQQSSVGIKKIIGGIAFAAISYFIMDWAITQLDSSVSIG